MVMVLVVHVLVYCVMYWEWFGYMDWYVFFNVNMIRLLYRNWHRFFHWYGIGFLDWNLDRSHDGYFDSLGNPHVNRLWYGYWHWYRVSHRHRDWVRYRHFDSLHFRNDVVVDYFVLCNGFEAMSTAASL